MCMTRSLWGYGIKVLSEYTVVSVRMKGHLLAIGTYLMPLLEHINNAL